MAGKRKRANGWEYVFKRAGILDKPLYFTFLSESEGDAFASRLDALLDRGIVPTEYLAPTRVATIAQLVREYERDAHPSDKDRGALSAILKVKADTPLTLINAKWVDDWISLMKRADHLAPSTIRARVGALARATDWGMRKALLTMPDHPFRSLPDGYAQYTKTDAALAGVERKDVERDRRLEAGEYEKVMVVLASGVLPRSQRPLVLEHVAELKLLFVLALESAMRLREMYTLTLDQVQLSKSTIFLDKTKNGDKRQVPLTTVAMAELKSYLQVRPPYLDGRLQDALFPWWSGSTEKKELTKLSDYLSKLYISIFKAAQCTDLHFHDLRHEATSRLFERTALSEAKIMKITGHKTHRMMMRYANLRGSDLASELW